MKGKCYHHPDREALAACHYCYRNLCSECILKKKDNYYCKNEDDCLEYQEEKITPQSTPQRKSEDINENGIYNEPEIYLCSDCGLQVSAEDKLCKNCGCDLSEIITDEENENTELYKSDNIYKKIKSGYKWYSLDQFYSDFRDSLMGKRDGWVWFYGLFLPLLYIHARISDILEISLLSLPNSILDDILDTFYLYGCISSTIVLIICLSYFFRKLWARKAMYALPFVIAFVFRLTMHGKISQDFIKKMTIEIIGGSVMFLVIYFLATKGVRNRAFFRLPISEAEIKKYWSSVSNRRANLSAWLSFLSPVLIIPGLLYLIEYTIGLEFSRVTRVMFLGFLFISISLFIIWLAKSARKKVNLDALPPIGGEKYIKIAFILPIIWLFILIFIFVAIFL